MNGLWKIIILHAKKDYQKAKNLSLTFNSNNIFQMKYHSFQHFAAYIRHSNLLITPDTSAVHVASAFNVPVIALYPGVEWNFVSWQPLSDLKISLVSKTERINDISVEEVLKAFDTIRKKIN
jgi:ADP-heptose:LPS heptosyltransferase